MQIEGAYEAEIINIAEYINTNYKEDQFVNIVKSHESTQSILTLIKTAAKITEGLSQANGKSDTKQDGMQHTPVWTCARISRNKSRRGGNHIVEPTNTS